MNEGYGLQITADVSEKFQWSAQFGIQRTGSQSMRKSAAVPLVKSSGSASPQASITPLATSTIAPAVTAELNAILNWFNNAPMGSYKWKMASVRVRW